jgi:tRNA1Val (adenine37-N6)-methyltransferase
VAGSTAPDTDGEITVDTLLCGRVTYLQPARGPRSSLDPVLLAAFLTPPHGRFLDIGCGTGALSFLLLHADPTATGVGIELQPLLARLAAAGRDRNGWGDRLRVVAGDVRAAGLEPPADGFDLVVTNPPFRPLGRGHTPPDGSRALAHHEVALTLDDWLDAAARAVRPGGRVAAIFPHDRFRELAVGLHARDLQPLRVRSVRPYADRPATRVLVEAQHGGRRPQVFEESLVVHAEGERYTEEVRRALGEV